MENKGQVKVSTWLIGMVLASVVVVFFSVFMASISTYYGISYDNSTLDQYNQLDELANNTKQIRDEEEGIKQRTGLFDIVGAIFSDGYTALKITKTSYVSFENILNRGVDDLNLGLSGKYLKIAISTIVLILIIIGVLLSAIIKRDL